MDKKQEVHLLLASRAALAALLDTDLAESDISVLFRTVVHEAVRAALDASRGKSHASLIG